ncbi:MAG: MMPL family transporter [Myxococcales bacterium]|nr:MMPL family transporter [Myxococcales bacterium]
MSFGSRNYSRRIRDGAQWCLEHPRATLLLCAVLLAGSAAGALAVEVDPSPEAYLAGTESWAFYEKINREYEIGEAVVVGLREPGGTVFDVETINAVLELGRVLEELDGVERVLSLGTATSLDKLGDTLDLAPLLRTRPATTDGVIDMAHRVASHPFYGQLLVDDNHETTFLFVQLAVESTDPVGRLATVEKIRTQADRFRTAHRSVHLGGTAVTKEAIAAGIQKDTLLFFPAALVLLTVLMWIIFGDWIGAAVPIAVVSFSSAVVVGWLALAGAELNMATATVPTIILVVGLADSVHILAELRRQFARSPDRQAALLATIESLAWPCLLTSATSAVGFFALISSRVGPLRQFGVASAVGLIAAYLSSMLLTPLLLSALRYPRARTRQFPAAPTLGRALSRFAGWANQRLGLSLAFTGLLFGASVAAISHIKLDSDFVRYVDSEHRLRKDLAVLERTLGGVDTLEIIVDGPNPGYFKEPAGLLVLDRLVRDLRQLDEVSGVLSLPDYLRLARSVMAGGAPDPTGPLPETAEEVAQLELVDPTTFSFLANDTLSQVRLTLQIRSMSSEAMLDLVEVIRQTTNLALEGTPARAAVTGLPPLFAQIVHNLVADAYGSFGVAAVLILIAMWIGLRSLGMAIVTMVPNVLTVGLTFGTMSLLGLSFDTNSAFVACLGIGIAVDDTIHIAARYKRAREEGSPTPLSAAQYALTHAGYPVVLTSVLLAVGFSVLCLSSFAPTFRVGLLSAILVAYAVLLDLVLLPILLITADRAERRLGSPDEASTPPVDPAFQAVSARLTEPPREWR